MPDHPSSELQGVFGQPFAEQVAFFRRKLRNLVPTERWDDIEREAHDQAFMVAGAAKADLLTDLGAAVDKVIAEGRGIEDFRRDFRAIVRRNGWTGWTGEGSVKGEAWRVGVIYRTNAYTSYAAGRRAQLETGKFPLWVYRHGGSEHPRLHHLMINGLILPSDHPAWAKLYPPSDWGCSCYVVGARSERAAVRLGGDPSKKLPADWARHIGKGWDYAPGASVSREVAALAAKIGSWDYRVAKAFMDELPPGRVDELAEAYRSLPSAGADARRYAQRIWDDRPDPAPGRTLGPLTRDQAGAIAREGVLDAYGFDFSLSPDELRHIRAEHGSSERELARGQRAIVPRDFGWLPTILSGTVPRPLGVSSRHNQPVFEISREIDGEEHVTRWEYWRRRRTLTLISYFVRTGERS